MRKRDLLSRVEKLELRRWDESRASLILETFPDPQVEDIPDIARALVEEFDPVHDDDPIWGQISACVTVYVLKN